MKKMNACAFLSFIVCLGIVFPACGDAVVGKAVVDGFQYYYTNLTSTTCMIYNWEKDPVSLRDITDDCCAIRLANGDELGLDSVAMYSTIRIPPVINGRTVTEIGEYAFYRVDRHPLRFYITWVIPNTVLNIRDRAFLGGEYSSAEFAEGSVVTNIGSQVFSRFACRDGVALKMPDSIKSLDYAAFDVCGFERISFGPDSRLATIGQSAFRGCSSLKALHVPDGVKSLGQWAFEGCRQLREVSLPGGLAYMGTAPFLTTPMLKTVVFRGDAPARYGDERTVFVGSEAVGATVYAPTAAKGFVVPGDTVATYFPTNLTDAVIAAFDEESRPRFQAARFPVVQMNLSNLPGHHYDDLAGVVWEFSVVAGKGQVTDCYTVGHEDDRQWILPTNGPAIYAPAVLSGHQGDFPLTTIAGSALKGKVSQPSVVMDFSAADSLVTIGREAFLQYEGLAEFVFPSNLTSIADSAFRESGVTNVVLPASVASTGNQSAFRACKNLERVEVKGTTPIANYTFYGCPKLKTVRFRETPEKVLDYALANCTGLVWVVFDKNAPQALGYYRSLFDGDCPNGVTNATVLVSPNTDYRTWNDAGESVNPRGRLWPERPSGSGMCQSLPVDAFADGGDDIFVPYSWCETYLPSWGSYPTVQSIDDALRGESVNYPGKSYAECFRDGLVPRGSVIQPFLATITIGSDGKVTIDATPKTPGYVYTPEGRDTLESTSPWGAVKASSRFFRVVATPR